MGNASTRQRLDLAAYLARLPHLDLSPTGRRNVAARFSLADEQLSAALAAAEAARQKGGRRG